MSDRTLTLAIPEKLYLQIEEAARTSQQSIDTIVVQTLERTIPSHLLTLLPQSVQNELTAMELLSDEALQEISMSIASDEQNELIDELNALKQDGVISVEQQQQLTALIELSETRILRKAHAFVLLKSRGYTLPPNNTLPISSR